MNYLRVAATLKARLRNTELIMRFHSKFDSCAGIVAVAALISGVLVGPAFGQLAGPPHAPYLARIAPHKGETARSTVNSMATNRGTASTQSDIAAEPFPAAPSGRAKSRAPIFAGGYRGGPPR